MCYLSDSSAAPKGFTSGKSIAVRATWFTALAGKLIRAQDIVINEKETLSHLQQMTQSLRNYADEEIAQIK